MRAAALPRSRSRVNVNLIWLLWIVIGLVVAAMHNYFNHVHTLRAVGSAVLAVLLWPLLFMGINLHIH